MTEEAVAGELIVLLTNKIKIITNVSVNLSATAHPSQLCPATLALQTCWGAISSITTARQQLLSLRRQRRTLQRSNRQSRPTITTPGGTSSRCLSKRSPSRKKVPARPTTASRRRRSITRLIAEAKTKRSLTSRSPEATPCAFCQIQSDSK